jgi:hypothetical protein
MAKTAPAKPTAAAEVTAASKPASRQSTTAPAAQKTPATRTAPAPGRRAAAAVQRAEHIALRVPGVGHIELPKPDQLAYFAALGLLVALEIVEWPAAAVLAAGHALITQRHSKALEEFGEALEEV